MGREGFISKAQKYHGKRYDYTQVVYVNNATPVVIICPVHGSFNCRPNNHLSGGGCKSCADARITKTTADFIAQATAAHGGRYDYSQVVYVNNKVKAAIVCPVHGMFKQIPADHMKGLGCEKCRVAGKTKTTADFIAQATAAHGGRYDYSQVVYVNNYTPATIICPVHGEFQQEPAGHLKSKGCRACAYDQGLIWSATGWANRQKGRMARLYILKLNGSGEEFYKAGITFLSIKRRYAAKIPYQYEIAALFESSNPKAIWRAELALKQELNSIKFVPSQSFDGQTECFTEIAPLLNLLNSRLDIVRV